ncbi:MAG: homocysteine S-methyltransferase family protein [Myxococcota bacterium]
MGSQPVRGDATRLAGPGGGGPRREAESLSSRLAGAGLPLLLDGATGTELERAGLPTGLPLWSTHALLDAPEAVQAIHRAYVAAGAEIVTANTFRTQARTLSRAGLPPESDRTLTQLAVDLARGAAREAGAACWVAGSLPPLEDCYAPERVPATSELDAEHARQVALLGEAGVDLLLVETMNSEREAERAARAAARSGLPFVVGLVSWQPGRLLSGDDLARTARALADAGAAAVGVNCVPPSTLAASLACLGTLDVPLFVSPNLGEPDDVTGFTRSEDLAPDAFADALREWLANPSLRLLGGCCGSRPETIRALDRARRARPAD